MDIQEALKNLIEGKIKPYQLEAMLGSEEAAVEVRKKYVESKYSVRLDHVGNNAGMDINDAAKRNIENMLGSVHVPVGYVELSVNGSYTPIFMATTEGKLVAGINRGAAAIAMSGGANAAVLRNGMTRSIIVETEGVKDSMKAREYIDSQDGRAFIESEYSKSSKRGAIIDIKTYITGRLLFIRYEVDTAAAMGMNIVTIASTSITKAIIEKLKALGVNAMIVSESGNLCSDKKPSMINMINGRGISVVAEAVVKKDVLERYFKVDAALISKVNYEKNYIGGSLAGALGHNAQIANILASTFLAYGQDVAQIVDGVNALDDTKAMENGDLYISVYIPSLEVGTIGGGTHMEAQRELLEASKVYGDGDDAGLTKNKLACIIAAAALAGELNLLAAEAGNELAAAHATLKRGK
ncbi:MAG: hypothetical protein QXR73_00030 [Candidatus Micrarchaeaceae archaeon]